VLIDQIMPIMDGLPMSMNAEVAAERNSVENLASSQEYLTFVLGDESYGIEILKVQEIRGYDAVTKIANTPDFIKGVVNLRGLIVPIVDLRIKFGLGKIEYDEFTVVIILNLHGRIVGIVVDGVSDVMGLQQNQMRAVPDIVASIDTRYITGLATVEEKMFILVDIEQLMNSQEMALMDSMAVH
jgi:purine-binding chemotaxis protein CheW